MFNKIVLYLKNLDWILFIAVLLLVSFGLIVLYSIALGQNEIDLLNFKKQSFFVVIGLLLLFVFAFFDYYNLRRYIHYFYLFGLVLLVSVLFFGVTVNGTTGWFYFGGFGLQPVEFIKLILILFLAKCFSSASLKVNALKYFLISGSGVLIYIALVLLQPDLGSALILLLMWLAVILLAGLNKKYFVIIFLILTILVSVGWVFRFEPYQKERVRVFLNPSADSSFRGYNIRQATIAIGAGGLYGRGLGFGSQSQLKFLPEAQTDFIFAVIAEELGFLGVVLIITFFAVFFYRCIVNLQRVKDNFGIFVILGAMGLIFIEMFINISMNIGMFPIIGISLPFLSYGGSSMISSLILVGIIEGIIIRSKINY